MTDLGGAEKGQEGSKEEMMSQQSRILLCMEGGWWIFQEEGPICAKAWVHKTEWEQPRELQVMWYLVYPCCSSYPLYLSWPPFLVGLCRRWSSGSG
jgi:hypothetical protein